MMRYVLISIFAFAATPILAQTENDGVRPFDAARSAVQATAQALDTDGNGLISRPELMSAAAQAFTVYDANDSGDIDEVEFKTSSFGFSDMARIRGREQAYDAAFGLVFDLFDRGGDRLLNNEEFLGAVDRAFSFADFDGDDSLTTQEFLRGFVTNVALRHAMRD